MGWEPKIGPQEGLADTYRWFCEHRLAPTAIPSIARLRTEISLS